jgi:hypothetical protein
LGGLRTTALRKICCALQSSDGLTQDRPSRLNNCQRAARGQEAERTKADRNAGKHDEPRLFGRRQRTGEGAGQSVPVAADDGDEGRYASIGEMATAERLERGYLGTLLRLILLAPDILDTILDGRRYEMLSCHG